ncbi:aprataxin and PNK-like factor isoform X2 [Rhineura floridana]|nr:aprataxin and PNK-like factor isoform X2 [Rhineura floridana]XP_061482170.1 aprataxin and PNK-like factor isoform X2 [Rhineura floridana]XP_061482171.1 aprataxin and PNK-like factor isoform X2 [Rhineura floridana]XP_061482172.1 aprataxin and PNK-like factor isoform X2 [Rhineura floridana]XP_061482173.1 aprataxin and PNK-like factor isoform X2 [Rhineura floridana]
MDTDKWHRLSPGDNFSLLVDKYIFRVLFSPSEVERKSDDVSVEDIPNQIPSTLHQTKMPQRQPSLQQTTSSSKSQLLEVNLQKAAEMPKKFSATISENEEPGLAQRKRVLPAWMLQEDKMVQSPSASGLGRGNSGEIKKYPGKKRKITESEDVALATQDVTRISAEPVVREMEDNKSKTVPQRAASPAGQCNRQLQNEEFNPDGQVCQLTETDTTNKRGDKLENLNSKTKQFQQDKPSQSPVHQAEIQELPVSQATETDISNLAESQDVPQSYNTTGRQRAACLYGTSCYRKNPIHFQQFSHPGDSDYHDTEPVTQADSDNRPECPYGTACYRKNPQHKLEYKHTAPPESERRQTRPKTIKKGRSILDDDNDNDGEPNEYNLNDSFIDDENEGECDPTDEDSDWEPDSEEKDNEDVDTLLKEAQNFVKTKK